MTARNLAFFLALPFSVAAQTLQLDSIGTGEDGSTNLAYPVSLLTITHWQPVHTTTGSEMSPDVSTPGPWRFARISPRQP